MKKQLVTLDIDSFPKEIQPFLQNAKVYDSSCHSFASVYYLDSGFYLKTDEKGYLEREARQTQYFFAKGLGVEQILYLSEDRDYMVTRAAIGEDATHALEDPDMLCDVMAKTLLALHRQPTEGAAVSVRMRRYLNCVETLKDRNFDPAVVMDRFSIRSKEEAVQIIEENKERLRLDTLIHGDACLPNVILDHGKFRCFIDFNLSGLGDKHVDLYWMIWSLEHNLKSEKYVDYFLDAYGRSNFDYDMLRVVAAFESIE